MKYPYRLILTTAILSTLTCCVCVRMSLTASRDPFVVRVDLFNVERMMFDHMSIDPTDVLTSYFVHARIIINNTTNTLRTFSLEHCVLNINGKKSIMTSVESVSYIYFQPYCEMPKNSSVTRRIYWTFHDNVTEDELTNARLELLPYESAHAFVP